MNREEAPEDLLLRARQCQLEEHDEKRFEVAVQSSRELELLYQAGVQFDARASLLPGDETRSSALVQRALERLDQGALLEARGAERKRGAGRSALRSLAVRYFAASLAFGLLLSVALASAWEYIEKRHAPTHVPELAAKVTTLPAAKPGGPGPLAPVSAKPEAAPAPPSASEAAPSFAVRRAPVSGLTHSAQVGSANHTPSEGQLFAQANELRRRGDSAGAVILYERLCNQYPSSAEAEDAQILLGNLLLGQRSARAALQKFDNYGSGALTLEALWGKAQALQSLGSPDERAVLETLVRDYPSSPYAGAAQRRLQELSP